MKSLSSSQKITSAQALLLLPLFALVSLLVLLLKERAWIVTFVLGAGFAWFGRRRLRETTAVGGWPKVVARVISTRIGESYEGDGITRYFPLVEFEYPLPFASCSTEAFSPAVADFGSHDRTEVERLLEAYSPGAIIDVYASPQNPGVAYVKDEISAHQRSHFLALITGGLILVVISALVGLWQY